jgi:putative ABC transport system permease protein
MTGILQDLRFGARLLLRSKALTALVVFALALGIGANSAMFSVVDALLLHPLSYAKPQELVLVSERDAQGVLHPTSAANFLDWRKANSFSGMAAIAASSYVITGQGEPRQITGARVTANMFDVLGVKPVLGRTFRRGEDGLDGGAHARLAVISYGMWQDVFGADANAVGRQIRLNDLPYQIIGVLPADFQLFERRHQVWVPALIDASNRDFRYLVVVARRSVPLAQAAAEMTALSASLREAYPDKNRGWTIQVDGFQEWLVNVTMRTRLLLLFAAVGLVLLLASSNVASLLLARSASRAREISLRIALGATRARIVVQLLTESVLLALLGGAAGLILASFLIDAAPSIVPAGAIPTSSPVRLNLLVIAFTLGVSLLTGILFGLAPALVASRPDVREALQESSWGSTTGRGRRIFRQSMVTLEVAVALALLAGASLMVQSLQNLTRADVGVNVNNVLTLRVFLPATAYNAERSLQFHRRVLEQVRALPGAEQAGLGTRLPLIPLGQTVPFDLETGVSRSATSMPEAGYVSVTPGYFRALGIPILRGRNFEDSDAADAPPVVIVNQAFANRYFPGQEAVGQRLRTHRPVLGSNDFGAEEHVRIVGVAGNVTLGEIGAAPEPILYAPVAQNLWSTTHWLTVRTTGDPQALAKALRDIVVQLDPGQPVDQPGTMAANFENQFAEPLFQSRVMGAFAGLAVVLAVVGIYGINSYSVTERRREIAVRLALGATPDQLLRDLVGRGMRLTGVGIAIGLLAAVAVNSALASLLVGVSAAEPLPLAAATLLLALVGALACYLPARRAIRVDPAEIFRQE